MIPNDAVVGVFFRGKKYTGRYRLVDGTLTIIFGHTGREHSVTGPVSLPMIRRLLRELIRDVRTETAASRLEGSSRGKFDVKRPATGGAPVRLVFTRNISGKWQWRLLSTDGHVVNESAVFDSRGQCEADAVTRGYVRAP
jgi:hypothetical protein